MKDWAYYDEILGKKGSAELDVIGIVLGSFQDGKSVDISTYENVGYHMIPPLCSK